MLYKLLFDRPRIIAILCGALSLFLAWRHSPWLAKFYDQYAVNLPGTLISILGFVITALALVMAIQDRGLLKYISEESPTLWRKLLGQFFATAYLAGGFTVILIIGTSINIDGLSSLTQTMVHAFFLYFFATIILQLFKLLVALERSADLAAKKLQR